MLDLIGPEAFQRFPWKNGKGETMELAISEGDNVQSFDWRISRARIEEDGNFSDFYGYQRTLVLLEGNGVRLKFGQGHSVKLQGELPVAEFDGSWHTFGELLDGPVTDLNIMTKSHRCQARVDTYTKPSRVRIQSDGLCFVYSHRTTLTLQGTQGDTEHQIPPGHLLKMDDCHEGQWTISGEDWVLIYLSGL